MLRSEEEEVVFIVAFLVVLPIASCQLVCDWVPPGRLAKIYGCCSALLGTKCDPKDGTYCFFDDPLKPYDGICICPPGQGFHFPMLEVYKRGTRPTASDIATDTELQRLRPLIRNRTCISFKHRGQPCEQLELAAPPHPQDEYYDPWYYVTSVAEYSYPPPYPNTGCEEHLTGMRCDEDTKTCECPKIPVGDPDYEDKENLQISAGVCRRQNVSYAGQACVPSVQRICWHPTDPLHLTCDSTKKICVCPDPKKDYFSVGPKHEDVRCATKIGYDGDCNRANHVSGWCSWRDKLACDKKTEKCKCADTSRTWLKSESKCLVADNQPCPKHEECISKFCYKGKCERQLGQTRPCPSGMNEQCSSGFCDPESKTCEYNTTEVKKSNEVRLEFKEWSQLVVLLGSISSALFVLYSM